MNFSESEIVLARQLRHHGLDWKPKAGHYVFDETGFCRQSSPFQPGVYFILNYDYFMQSVGGVERFKEIMTWLPTWEDAREILGTLNFPDRDVAAQLQLSRAVERGSERLMLYEMISVCLQSNTAVAAALVT